MIEAIAHSSRGFFPADVNPLEPAFERISITLSIAGTLRLLIAGVQLCFRRKVWPLTGLEITLWYVAMLITLIVEHAQPIPSYVGDPNIYVFMHHLQVFVWVNLLWMSSSRTRRLTKVYYSYRKRENSRGGWFFK